VPVAALALAPRMVIVPSASVGTCTGTCLMLLVLVPARSTGGELTFVLRRRTQCPHA
jgi:hypothetical protein